MYLPPENKQQKLSLLLALMEMTACKPYTDHTTDTCRYTHCNSTAMFIIFDNTELALISFL